MKLTDTQLRTLKLVAKGYSNSEIARKEGISVYTVANRLFALCYTLNVHSKLNAVRVALLNGILTIDDLKGGESS